MKRKPSHHKAALLIVNAIRQEFANNPHFEDELVDHILVGNAAENGFNFDGKMGYHNASYEEITQFLCDVTIDLSYPPTANVAIRDMKLYLTNTLCIPLDKISDGLCRTLRDNLDAFELTSTRRRLHNVSFDDIDSDATQSLSCNNYNRFPLNSEIVTILNSTRLLWRFCERFLYGMLEPKTRLQLGYSMFEEASACQSRIETGKDNYVNLILSTWRSIQHETSISSHATDAHRYKQVWPTMYWLLNRNPTCCGQREVCLSLFAHFPLSSERRQESIATNLTLLRRLYMGESVGLSTLPWPVLYGFVLWSRGGDKRPMHNAQRELRKRFQNASVSSMGQWPQCAMPYVGPSLWKETWSHSSSSVMTSVGKRIAAFCFVHNALFPFIESSDIPMETAMCLYEEHRSRIQNKSSSEPLHKLFIEVSPHLVHILKTIDASARCAFDAKNSELLKFVQVLESAMRSSTSFGETFEAFSWEIDTIQNVLVNAGHTLHIKATGIVTRWINKHAPLDLTILRALKIHVSVIDAKHSIHFASRTFGFLAKKFEVFQTSNYVFLIGNKYDISILQSLHVLSQRQVGDVCTMATITSLVTLLRVLSGDICVKGWDLDICMKYVVAEIRSRWKVSKTGPDQIVTASCFKRVEPAKSAQYNIAQILNVDVADISRDATVSPIDNADSEWQTLACDMMCIENIASTDSQNGMFDMFVVRNRVGQQSLKKPNYKDPYFGPDDALFEYAFK